MESEISRVFVSHASKDKRSRVRPLVEALALEGVSLWLDRPGAGADDFGFDEKFIRKYDIKGLVAGLDWDTQILEAHRSCGVVLACVSRALCKERQVLVHELVLARYAGKLVSCVIDDLPFEEIPSDLGLLDISKLQSPRVDVAVLMQAVNELKANCNLSPANFDPPLASQWQILRQLVSDINQVFARRGLTRVSEADMDVVRATLRAIPVDPMVRAFEIPFFVIELFAARLQEPDAARRHFKLSMDLALQCADAEHTPLQSVVSLGDVINPDKNPPIAFWGDVLTAAGYKSRRTLAALLLAPGPLAPGNLPDNTARELSNFVAWLTNPNMTRPTSDWSSAI
ncbi:hypothetical protein SAMN05216404_104100 [Nitrosospira multiformis]|uniref:TIR domain-containing protein n=1 Tax=Nitrosospira multiformis TaxID=1231 RepID=A0A1H8G588_9PROT|nr:toll/interleukin-1 receptor domain-containing protein [Nitrosospira multiformis]SEN39162.1 hypothetical protein SAMN05216404_104100 [Nitrosospira multiformis]